MFRNAICLGNSTICQSEVYQKINFDVYHQSHLLKLMHDDCISQVIQCSKYKNGKTLSADLPKQEQQLF